MRGDVISGVLFCYRLFHKLKIIFLKRFSLHALQALKDSISRHSLNVAGSILLLLPFLCLPNHQTYKHTPCRFYFSRDRQINDAPSYTRNIRKVFFARQVGHNMFQLKKNVSRDHPLDASVPTSQGTQLVNSREGTWNTNTNLFKHF